MNARTLLVLVTVLAAVLGHTSPSFSTASFTSSSSTGLSTIQAAKDWTPPEVTMVNPGTAVKGSTTLSAEASDADSAVRSVTIQHRGPSAGSWSDVCTATVPPFSCTWDTVNTDDGEHSLRARATDTYGNTATSATVTTAVANKLTVVLTAPAEIIRGTTDFITTLHHAGSTPYRVTVEYAPTGTNTWATACTNLDAPYTCRVNTTAVTDGEYDLRATAHAGSTATTSELVRKIRVDNTAPSVNMADPGSPLRGTLTFTSTASDSGSGVAEVRMQYSVAGTGSWADLCVDTTAPYSCQYDTKKLTDGTYNFRAVATDRAGNSSTSALVTNRAIENTVSTVTMASPGSNVSGNVSLNATASSTAGVQSVAIQHAPSGSTAWTTVCTATTSPYTCDWNSRSVANGQHSFRAVLTDGNGTQTVSQTVTGVRVDNPLMRGLSVHVSNGRGWGGEVDPGDQIVYTFSEQANLGSVTPGWNGGSIPVTVRLQDGGLINDSIDILRGGSQVNLGSVNLRNNYINTGATATFNATMNASTTTVNGAQRTVITVTLGEQASGGSVTRGVLFPSTMIWSPSSAVTNQFGIPMSTDTVSTSGNRF